MAKYRRTGALVLASILALACDNGGSKPPPGTGGAGGAAGAGGGAPPPTGGTGGGSAGSGGAGGGAGAGGSQADAAPPAPPRDAGVDRAPADRAPSPDLNFPRPDGGPPSNPAVDEVCTPMVDFMNQVATTAGGMRFDTFVPDPVAAMQAHSRAICRFLYRTPDEVRKNPRIRLIIENAGGVAFTSGGAIHFSGNYIGGIGGNAMAQAFEINGVLSHEDCHVWQNTNGGGWLVEGMADYIRYRTGWDRLSRRRRGGTYKDAYTTTGFFLVWIEDTYDKDFGYKVNIGMKNNGFSFEQFVQQLTGKDVNTLWNEYQAAIP